VEDERCAGAAVVLVLLGRGLEEGRGEGYEGEDSVEGDYLVGVEMVFIYCNEECMVVRSFVVLGLLTCWFNVQCYHRESGG
jgi:hypothetical protein